MDSFLAIFLEQHLHRPQVEAVVCNQHDIPLPVEAEICEQQPHRVSVWTVVREQHLHRPSVEAVVLKK